MMIIRISLLELLFMTTIVNSLPQLADVSASLYSDNSGKLLAMSSENPADVAPSPDTSYFLSG